MVSRARVLVAASLILLAGAAGCRSRGLDRDHARLANIYGTWSSQQFGGGYTVVLLADTDATVVNSRLIGRIPGESSGKIMVRESAKGKWLVGIYKVVGEKVLARSSTEETWALTLRCDLKRGKLYLPTGDGKDTELFRSAQTGVTEPAGGKPAPGPTLRPPGF